MIPVQDFLKRQNFFPDNQFTNYKTIAKKLQKKQSRIEKEDLISSNYVEKLKKAHNTDLSELLKGEFFKLITFKSVKKPSILLLYAYKLPHDKHKLSQIELLLIATLDEIIYKGYILVYFNNKIGMQKWQASFVKNLYHKLPLKYLLYLDKIYIIHPTLMLKSLFLFAASFRTKIFRTKLKYIKNIEKLKKQSFFQSEILAAVTLELENLNNFDNPINNMKGFVGCDFDDFSLGTEGVPELIIMLITWLDNSKRIKNKGLFRISGGENELKIIEKKLENNDYIIKDEENVHNVTTILKRVFSKAPEPLFPKDLYDEIVKIGEINEKNKEEILSKQLEIIKKIDITRKKTLLFLLNFLKKVIEKQSDNLMDAFNISVVWTPCLIRPKEYSEKTIKETKNVINFLKFLIENQSLIFKKFMKELDESLFTDHSDESFDDIPTIKFNEETKSENEISNHLLKKKTIHFGDSTPKFNTKNK